MAEVNEAEVAEFGALYLRRQYERVKRLFDMYPQEWTPTAEDLVRVTLGGPLTREPPPEEPGEDVPPPEDGAPPES